MLVEILFSALLWLPQENLQIKIKEQNPYLSAETISLEKTGISPNADGLDDSLVITYNLSGVDNYCTMSILDARGNTLKVLLQNESISGSGRVIWDGSDNENKTVPAGYYSLVSQVWSKTGDIRRFRSRVIVIR